MITAHQSFRTAARLLSCARGNVALMFALMALPLAVMAGFGVDPVLSRPEAVEAQTRADIERWGKVAKALGLKID